jgi:hypothetical protein
MATRSTPWSWKRRDQRFSVEGSSWPSAVQAAAARSHVSPACRRVSPPTMTARAYRWRGTTRSSKTVTTLSQLRHLQRCWQMIVSPSNANNRRDRRSCVVHRLPPHLGQPGFSADATLGAVRNQPSERGRQAQLRRLPPFPGRSLFPGQLITDHCEEITLQRLPDGVRGLVAGQGWNSMLDKSFHIT